MLRSSLCPSSFLGLSEAPGRAAIGTGLERLLSQNSPQAGRAVFVSDAVDIGRMTPRRRLRRPRK